MGVPRRPFWSTVYLRSPNLGLLYSCDILGVGRPKGGGHRLYDPGRGSGMENRVGQAGIGGDCGRGMERGVYHLNEMPQGDGSGPQVSHAFIAIKCTRLAY